MVYFAISWSYFEAFIVLLKYEFGVCWNPEPQLINIYKFSSCHDRSVTVDDDFFHQNIRKGLRRSLYFGEVAVFPFLSRCRIVICPAFWVMDCFCLKSFSNLLRLLGPFCYWLNFAIPRRAHGVLGFFHQLQIWRSRKHPFIDDIIWILRYPSDVFKVCILSLNTFGRNHALHVDNGNSTS